MCIGKKIEKKQNSFVNEKIERKKCNDEMEIEELEIRRCE
jgi:hypothetical protein